MNYKIQQLPKEFLDVISENDDLQRYLANLAKGKPFTDRSWLYEDEDPDDVLADWMNRLTSLETGSTFEREVFQFDTSQLTKWGPQGGVAPMSDLLESTVLPTFSRGNSPSPRAFSDFNWDEAEIAVINELMHHGVQGLRPASATSVVVDMRARDTLESNSGWPDFARRNLPGVLQAAIDAANDGAFENYPAIALFRNYNQKTRLVWMFPESCNINEGRYCQPAQSAIINSGNKFYAPWTGFETVRDLITEAYANGAFLTASDFSKTDEHFTLNSTQRVSLVLRNLFVRESMEGLVSSLEHMHKIPLIISDTEYVMGTHGVASGSNWTNFVETIFDDIFGWYVSFKTSDNTTGLCAIGDDMLWESFSYDEGLATTLAECGKAVGQDLNSEKVTNERDRVKFLQRLFQRGYSRPDGRLRGVYSTIRALKSSIYPERMHKRRLWSSDMFCARQYMILENCVDHPLFEEFVKFIVHGQKDLIPFAKKGRPELDSILRKTKLLPGFNPTYNQEKRDSSLADFESMKIARSL